MAILLKGAEVCGALKEKLIEKNRSLIANGITPCLKIVRIGAQPDDLSYERGAIKRFDGLGIAVEVAEFAADIAHEDFESAFCAINADPHIHGILLFRPMPKQIDEEAIQRAFAPEKDVDGMCTQNISKVFVGDPTGFAPCTPRAVIELLKHYQIPLKGKKIALVGRSMVVGKPLVMLLLQEHATVTVCHTRTADLAGECKAADIIIAAAGAAKMIGPAHVRADTVVIDVGINLDENGALCGDVDFAAVEPLVQKITPVPGGVGSVTTSILALHVLEAAERALSPCTVSVG